MQTGQQHQRPVSPPWKIRTRPCPFYSSGRCLFSDACAFRHVIKSPLTPVDYNAISEYKKSHVQEEPYNILNNGEYDGDGDGDEDEDDESSRDWSKEVKNTPPVTGTHAREYSYDSVTSRTETGTVRGERVTIQEDHRRLVEEDNVMGLGLTNMYDVRRPQAPVPMFDVAAPLPLPVGSKPHLSVSNPPFAFHAREPSSLAPSNPPLSHATIRKANSRTSSLSPESEIMPRPHNSVASAAATTPTQTAPLVLPTTIRKANSRTYSLSQELEVKPHPHSFVTLAKPGASSLLQSRSRKNTLSNQQQYPVVDEMGLLVPGADFSGSPTITLKRLAEANNPYINVGVQDMESPEPVEIELEQEDEQEMEADPSPYLEAPPIDYENESPSIARQRFQRAFKLVTKELRQRIAHIRKSPVTPEHPDTAQSDKSQDESKEDNHVQLYDQPKDDVRYQSQDNSKDDIGDQEPQPTDQPTTATTESPSYLDDYLHSEPALYEATEASEATVKSRAWMKPLRLSTLGTQLLSANSQSSTGYSIDISRSPAEALPSSRSSSPIKRPLSSAISRKSPQNSRQNSRQNSKQNSRQNSRKNTLESLGSANPVLASPFVDAGEVPPVPPIFPSPATTPTPRTQRSGSISYIHSPSPSRWTPSHTQPRAELLPSSARSVSPTRAAKPSPIEPSRRPSLRPKSAAPSQASSTPVMPTEHPKLFFAIASTKPDEVARLLATGEASPNETVGPHDMHALTFAMENMANADPAMLPQMEEVVATLLSYGADPNVLEEAKDKLKPSDQSHTGANPLVNYFLDKAQRSPIPTHPSNAPNEDEIPLRRAKFAIVGQEFGLMELARAYAAHVRLAKYLVDEDDDSELPFVAVFAGLSGHGKTLLASKVGGLLAVPTYTINTTLIKGYGDLWSVPSCHAREADEHSTLREFLHAHDHQRAVVVIDEIEKIHDRSLLQSLLVPWETGRLQEGTFSRTIDISRTLWLCTSNIGSQDILKSLKDVNGMDEGSFDLIAKQTRSQLRDVLGASLIARVSSVVPFLPFSAEERLAISSKCLSALRHKLALSRQTTLPKVSWDGVLEKAAREYVEAEGARSIRRSILRLVDAVLHDV